MSDHITLMLSRACILITFHLQFVEAYSSGGQTKSFHSATISSTVTRFCLDIVLGIAVCKANRSHIFPKSKPRRLFEAVLLGDSNARTHPYHPLTHEVFSAAINRDDTGTIPPLNLISTRMSHEARCKNRRD